MLSMLKRLWRDKSGDDTLEYALLVALIAILMLSSLYTFGSASAKPYDKANVVLTGADGSAASSASGGSGGSNPSGSSSGGQGGGSASGSSSSGQGGSDQSGGSSDDGGNAGRRPINPAPIGSTPPDGGGQ